MRKIPVRRSVVEQLIPLCASLGLYEPRVTKTMLVRHHYVLDGYTAVLVDTLPPSTSKNTLYRSIPNVAYFELYHKSIMFDLRLVDVTAFVMREITISLKINPAGFPDLLSKQFSKTIGLEDSLMGRVNDQLKQFRLANQHMTKFGYIKYLFDYLTIDDLLLRLRTKLDVLKYADRPVTYTSINVPYKIYYAVAKYSKESGLPLWACFASLLDHQLMAVEKPLPYIDNELMALQDFKALALKIIDPEGKLSYDPTKKEKA